MTDHNCSSKKQIINEIQYWRKLRLFQFQLFQLKIAVDNSLYTLYN